LLLIFAIAALVNDVAAALAVATFSTHCAAVFPMSLLLLSSKLPLVTVDCHFLFSFLLRLLLILCLPSFAVVCCHLLSFAIVCHRLPSSAVICRHLPSFAIICHHLPSFAIVCRQYPHCSCSLLQT